MQEKRRFYFYCQLLILPKRKLKTKSKEKSLHIITINHNVKNFLKPNIQKDSFECMEKLIYYLHFSQPYAYLIMRAIVNVYKSLT